MKLRLKQTPYTAFFSVSAKTVTFKSQGVLANWHELDVTKIVNTTTGQTLYDKAVNQRMTRTNSDNQFIIYLPDLVTSGMADTDVLLITIEADLQIAQLWALQRQNPLHQITVTPSDTVDCACGSGYVSPLADATIKVTTVGGEDQILNLTANAMSNTPVRRVWATGITAGVTITIVK